MFEFSGTVACERCVRNYYGLGADVLIHKITTNRRAEEYELHIKRILGFKHWDKRRRLPKK